MARLTVMIRYSQRDAGVLYRTLKSIASQSALELIERVLIVDDCSPVSAQSELTRLSEEFFTIIHIIPQRNQGV